MIDREKVIEHLYDCLAASKPENMWVFVRKDIVGDALALLKDQEPVEPEHNLSSLTDWLCGKCGRSISRFEDYCPSCGRKVKWE